MILDRGNDVCWQAEVVIVDEFCWLVANVRFDDGTNAEEYQRQVVVLCII